MKKAGLASRNTVLNVPRCVSLVVVFDFSSFYFSSLADWISCEIQRTIKQELRSRLCSLFCFQMSDLCQRGNLKAYIGEQIHKNTRDCDLMENKMPDSTPLRGRSLPLSPLCSYKLYQRVIVKVRAGDLMPFGNRARLYCTSFSNLYL